MNNESIKKDFIYNAIEDGWMVKKINHKYCFMKKHENKKEYFDESFLNDFIMKYIDSDNLEQVKLTN
jgi:sulfatase maturation enzyme AslB (radical SAM superfamily)